MVSQNVVLNPELSNPQPPTAEEGSEVLTAQTLSPPLSPKPSPKVPKALIQAVWRS